MPDENEGDSRIDERRDGQPNNDRDFELKVMNTINTQSSTMYGLVTSERTFWNSSHSGTMPIAIEVAIPPTIPKHLTQTSDM